MSDKLLCLMLLSWLVDIVSGADHLLNEIQNPMGTSPLL